VLPLHRAKLNLLAAAAVEAVISVARAEVAVTDVVDEMEDVL